MSSPASDDVPELPISYSSPTSAEELLRRYEAGERYFPDADIPENASLRGAVLAGAVFKDFWLSCVDLREADLRNCRFENGNVKCSAFDNADLRDTVFIEVHVEATSWHGANVEGTDFSGAYYHGSPVDLGFPAEFPFGRWGGSC